MIRGRSRYHPEHARSRLALRAWLFSVLAPALGACVEGEPSEAGDTGGMEGQATDTGPQGPVECDTAPVVTYDTFGQGFLRTYCQGCHSAAVEDRKGAPEESVFDTRDQASAWADRILARSIPAEGVAPMPPVGGITPEDLERAQVWLTCYP